MTCPLSLDPRFYQEIRERGLNTSPESDDDLLDESCSPEGTRKVAAPIVVKTYRPPQVTWSQLPEVVESGILDTLPAEERKRQEVRGRAGAQPAPQPRHRGPRGPPTHQPPPGQTPGCWLAPLAGWGQGQPPSLLLG